jgi:ketosteroid isomerase-like protein
MSDVLARLVAEAEIRRTLADYCQSCDDGRFEDYAACFTVDAVVLLAGEPVASGRAALRDWIAAGQPPDRRGKHVTINPLITVSPDATSAAASTDFLFVGRSPEGPRVTVAGRYCDELQPADGRWLISRREITFL